MFVETAPNFRFPREWGGYWDESEARFARVGSQNDNIEPIHASLRSSDRFDPRDGPLQKKVKPGFRRGHAGGKVLPLVKIYVSTAVLPTNIRHVAHRCRQYATIV